ncbi:hypothetical protein [Paludisphaera soli]|uniref:hypothetical protein n=1 Tax=Paludisphaera soli TaxID=2712865 RepID=UPI0013EE2815|nr:hypothetical protein [Paludisphaera soli]
MASSESLERFQRRLAASGVPLAELTPEVGLGLLVRQFLDEPDGKLMGGRFGDVSCYEEEETLGFRFSFRDYREDFDPGFDLMFRYGSPAEFGPLCDNWGEFWQLGADDVDRFRAAVEGSAAFRALGRSPAAGVAIQDSDEAAFALFDCWGVRDPSRPVVHMTEEEWLRSDDVGLMLRWFRQEWRGDEAELDRLVQRYLLACCRRIWPLLPHEGSRQGVEALDRFVQGRATDRDYSASYFAEGAAFYFEYNPGSEKVVGWCDRVTRLSPRELDAMIQSPRPGDDLSPRGLMMHAAYLVDSALCYPGLRPKESIERYRIFLPAPLLRATLGNPFRVEG